MAQGIIISQEELEEVVRLERQYKAIGEQLEDRRSRLLPLILEGFPVEIGRLEARAVKHIGRTGFSYKQLVINELGVEAAEAYKRQFPTHLYFELEIVEHAVPPDVEGLVWLRWYGVGCLLTLSLGMSYKMSTWLPRITSGPGNNCGRGALNFTRSEVSSKSS